MPSGYPELWTTASIFASLRSCSALCVEGFESVSKVGPK